MTLTWLFGVRVFMLQNPASPPPMNTILSSSPPGGSTPSAATTSPPSVLQFVCTQCANVFATHSELAKHQDAFHGAGGGTSNRYV